MSNVIRIAHSDDDKYQLIFERVARRMANHFIDSQFGEGGAEYVEWDLARLEEACLQDTDFAMTYDTLGELQDAINKVPSEYEQLSYILDDLMSDFLAHNPGLRPR